MALFEFESRQSTKNEKRNKNTFEKTTNKSRWVDLLDRRKREGVRETEREMREARIIGESKRPSVSC